MLTSPARRASPDHPPIRPSPVIDAVSWGIPVSWGIGASYTPVVGAGYGPWRGWRWCSS